jgi:hypothetical protein
MKKLVEYIEDKTYPLRVKFAVPLTTEQVAQLEKLLDRYELVNFQKPKKTPPQSRPMHFEGVKNAEIYIVDCEVRYPAAPHIVRELVVQEMRIPHSHVYVRTPYDPSDEAMPDTEEGKSKLADGDYKDAPKTNSEDVYGTKFNQKFIKGLTKGDSFMAGYDDTEGRMSPLGNKKS